MLKDWCSIKIMLWTFCSIKINADWDLVKSGSTALICFVSCLQHYTCGNSPSIIKALAGEVDASFFSILQYG